MNKLDVIYFYIDELKNEEYSDEHKKWLRDRLRYWIDEYEKESGNE